MFIFDTKALNIFNDVKVVLNSINKSDNYQSGFDENRMIVWDLSFQVFADYMPTTEESTIIQTVIADTVEIVSDEYVRTGKMPEYMNGRYGLKVREEFVPKIG